MLLIEVFDKPAKWKVTHSIHDFIAIFTIGEQSYEFEAEETDDGTYDVSFAMRTAGGKFVTNITNTGNANQVLATVIAIFKQFISQKHPIQISFTAKEPSRIKLYDRLAQQLSKAGYSSVDAPPISGGKAYEFVRG